MTRRAHLAASVAEPARLEAPTVVAARTPPAVHARWLGVYAAALGAKWVIFTQVWNQSLATGVDAWDGQHYLDIARAGYPGYVAHSYSLLAFFPGTPLLIRALQPITGSYVVAGFVESCVAGALVCLFGFQLVSARYGPDAALRAAVLLAVAPGGFLYGMGYAEPAAVALSLATLVCLDRRRYRLGVASAVAAGLCSPFSMPLVAAAAWVALRRRSAPAAAVAAGAPAGFLAFQLYAWARTGRFPVWFAAQRSFGQGFQVANTVERFTQSSAIGIPVTVGVCLVLVAVAIACLARIAAPATWWLVALPVVGVGLFSGGSWLDPRLLLDAFPLELAVGVAARGATFKVLAVASFVAMVAALAAYVVFWPDIVAQP
jgi:hypothetical protein